MIPLFRIAMPAPLVPQVREYNSQIYAECTRELDLEASCFDVSMDVVGKVCLVASVPFKYIEFTLRAGSRGLCAIDCLEDVTN